MIDVSNPTLESFARAGGLTPTAQPDTYRGWAITWDYGYYSATSPNYEASYEGEEDGWVDNGQRVQGRTREAVCAEVDAWLEEHEAARQVAWLIEMVNNDAPTPRYWNPSKFKKGWVWDANEAIRFCREQDARDFLDGQSMALPGKPVEHVFLAALSPPDKEARK